jgi:fumarylacetoacetase
MDYELEMGYFVSKPIPYGSVMSIKEAKEHIFGFVLLNDWSARDHQLFEMRPLGPFHSKGFGESQALRNWSSDGFAEIAKHLGTSISNWIVPIEALERFSCPPNTKQDPAPFKHLTWPTPETGALDVKLRIKLVRDGKESLLGSSNLKYMYWTPYQQLVCDISEIPKSRYIG